MTQNDSTPNLVDLVRNAQETQPAAAVTPATPHNDAALRPTLPETDEQTQQYEGGGIVITANSDSPKLPPTADVLNPETMASLSEYMLEADKELEEFNKIQEEKAEEEAASTKAPAEEEKDPEDSAQEREDKFNEAIVIIDKLGMGGSVNFTAEEREKLEKVKKIRLEEVETVNIKKFKTKKAKKNNLDNILKRQPSVHTTPIIAPASGYTASIKGASTYELIALMNSSDNPLIDTETKWSVIHNKLAETSIGKMNFNDFLRSTAAVDYNMFIYGLLCATYPDDDKLPLNCANEKCGKPFDHNYSVRSLLRAEKMSTKLQEQVTTVIDAAHTEELAKAAHSNSAVNQIKVIQLPLSGYVLEVYVQSAHDLIYNSIKGLSENTEERLSQASILSTVIKTAYLPDPDEEGEYFEYTEAMEITRIIYTLVDQDILVLTSQSEKALDDLSFDFGLMNVKCPHCGDFREEVPFDIESILFYRYQQAMNTEVE